MTRRHLSSRLNRVATMLSGRRQPIDRLFLELASELSAIAHFRSGRLPRNPNKYVIKRVHTAEQHLAANDVNVRIGLRNIAIYLSCYLKEYGDQRV